MNIELMPWTTPNFVSMKGPPGKRQDGFHPDDVPKFRLSDLDEDALSEQCDRFRAEVFRKAGKKDPST